MKVLIAGAGAVGQWLAARLAAAGHEPVLLLRPHHQQAIDHSGLHVRGHTRFHGRLPSVTRAEDAGEVPMAILTCKAHATATTGAAVAKRLTEDGCLASLQNGLGNGDKLARLVGADRVAVSLTSQGLTQEAPGRVLHAGDGPTHVGPVPGADPACARRLLGLLDDAGLQPRWHDDITPAVWTKAAVNAGLNPLAALHGVRNGALLADPRLFSQAQALVEEVHALSRAAGVLLPDDLLTRLKDTLERTADNKCSMLQDVEARRPTEVEQITGWFVRLARRLGHPLPENEQVYRQVKGLEAGYLGQDLSLRMAREEAEAMPEWH